MQRFRSVPPYKLPFSFRFKTERKAIFTAETVAQRIGPIFAKQALIDSKMQSAKVSKIAQRIGFGIIEKITERKLQEEASRLRNNS